MITVITDTFGISFKKVSSITVEGFMRAGFKQANVIDYRFPALGKAYLLIIVGDTVSAIRTYIHRMWIGYGENRLWWTDTPLELDIPDPEIDYINEHYCVVACSQYEKKRYSKEGFKVCSVVGRPINDQLIERVRNEPGKYDKIYGKYIITVSSDLSIKLKYPRKGLDIFDQAIGLIKNELHNRGIKVIAITNQYLRNADLVFRSGSLDERTLYELIRDSLLFVFPSRKEGFGLPPIEAMSLGKLVVYSDTPSHNENVVGIRVESDYELVYEEIPLMNYRWYLYNYRPEDLAKTILYALDLIEKDPQYVDKIKEKALKKAREFYSLNIVSKLYKVVA